MSFMTAPKQTTQRVPTGSIKSTAATIEIVASTVRQTTSLISPAAGPGTSSPSFNNTSGNSEIYHRAGTISGAIIGGAVVAAVVIISSAVVIFIVRRSRYDDGVYVDILPSNVNSLQTGTDNGGYLIPITTPQQSDTSGIVLEDVPPASPSEHVYAEPLY
ncbi:uncharacterized protein LOC144877221 [Branchiostoma floridae x Branchiostoma japonicum]